MKTLLLLCFWMIFSSAIQAQGIFPYQWGTHTTVFPTPYNAGSVPLDMAVDAAGNVYITGAFSGTEDFEPGPGVDTITDLSNQGGYFAKYDPNGNLVFVKQFVTQHSRCAVGAFNLEVTPNGSIYISGYFNGEVDFDPSANVEIRSDGNPFPGFLISSTFFFAKYDTDGNFVFCHALPAYPNSSRAWDMQMHPDGTLYMLGGTDTIVDVDFGSGVSNVGYADSAMFFVAQYDTAGTLLYHLPIPVKGVSGFAVDNARNIYLSGSLVGSLSLGGYTVTSISNTNSDIWFGKMNSLGNVAYLKTIGGTGTDITHGLVADGQGGFYMDGIYSSSNFDFDPGPNTVIRASAGGVSDGYVARYDANGDLVFVNTVAGTGNEWVVSLELDVNNSILVGGYFSTPTIDMDPSNAVHNITSLNTNGFVAKYSSTGQYEWAYGLTSTSYSNVQKVLPVGSSKLYLAGDLYNKLDADFYGVDSLGVNNGLRETYVAAYYGLCLTPVISTATLTTGLPADTLTITGSGFSNSGNTVTIAGTNAVIISESDTLIRVYFPCLGGASGNLALTNDCGNDTVLLNNTFSNTVIQSTLTQSICQGQAFEGYTVGGTYVDTLPSASGCDSVRTLVLTVNNSSAFTQNIVICSGESYLAGGALQTTAGSYYDTLVGSNNCDSVLTTVLTVDTIPAQPLVNNNGNQLVTNNVPGQVVQWYLNGQLITGADSVVLQVQNAGHYQVEITDNNGCTALSDSLYATPVGIDETNATTSLAIYPNPTAGHLVIEIKGNVAGKLYGIEVWNMLGAKVVSFTEATGAVTRLDLTNLKKGVYIVRVSDGVNAWRQRIVLQ